MSKPIQSNARAMLCGTSLIELLICLCLISLLMITLLNIYQTVLRQAAWRSEQMQVAIQAQFALDVLRQALWHAGLQGCAQNVGMPALWPNEKRLILQGAKPHYVDVRDTQMDNVILTYPLKVHPGQTILLSNCHQNELASIAAVHTRMGQRVLQLDHVPLGQYHQGSELALWQRLQFFVRKTAQKDQLDKAIYALYVRENDQPAQAVIDGIEDMQLSYLVKRAGQLHFYPASTIPATASIVAVRITLLSRVGHLQKTFSALLGLRQVRALVN